ncbi:MAG TPA: alkaline phosphatase family protein [Candidatus Acidoferrales bacterium]|nr:alkaline phosphatase family protein [Candidatus Acidoferrales bacterium]
MKVSKKISRPWEVLRRTVAVIALFQFTLGAPAPAFAKPDHDGDGGTRTPIKHVIVIIGENRTFDHIFATYQPQRGQFVDNLLSKGIVNADGTPGPNYSKATQFNITDTTRTKFELSPSGKTPFATLPPPLAGGPMDVCANNGICSLADAMASEDALAPGYYQFLTTGGTGIANRTPDTRIANVFNLPSGPFQLTPGVPYDGYAASPVHRFYQMWQQLDCQPSHVSINNLSGCTSGLFPWVEVSVGAGANGIPQPATYSFETTGEGSTSMGFYNVQQGDVPYLKYLADSYSMSDNYHQAVMGGTGANHVMIGFADAIWFSDGNGNPAVPPENTVVYQGTPDAGTVNEIEDPDPQPGTTNWYLEDGYGSGGFGSPFFGGGTYSNCADPSQPGVAEIRHYLKSLPGRINPNCEPGHYYLLNNYNPGYFGDGSNAYTDNNPLNYAFTIPPTSVRNIGDAMLEKNISWKYYGDQWNAYLNDKYQLNYGVVGANSDQYCNICNPFQYATSIMTNDAVRTAHLQDTDDLYNDIANGTLPAVSFVKPSGWVDGHPASSKIDLFEGFTKKLVDAVQAQPSLWKDTAIFITFDEGGGYWDSGYVQALDYFGDGTRIPMIVVSPYATGGRISHVYSDHVSIVKFIEYNWRLKPLTHRSRDNYPNPVTRHANPYVPLNGPAIGDLTDLFNFGHAH